MESPAQQELLFIQDKIPSKRNDINPFGHYPVSVFNVIMDKTATSFNMRFSPEAQDMLQDLALLDPRSFSSIEETGLLQNSLEAC